MEIHGWFVYYSFVCKENNHSSGILQLLFRFHLIFILKEKYKSQVSVVSSKNSENQSRESLVAEVALYFIRRVNIVNAAFVLITEQ